MTDLCREFGISRKTGYKIAARYERLGQLGLLDEPRRPERSPQRTCQPTRELVAQLRREQPTWGPKKLKSVLERRYPAVRIPAASTIGQILLAEKLVRPGRRRRRVTPYEHPLGDSKAPNDIWCADFKGQFRLGNGRYCYPLTISDHFSRFLLAVDGLGDTKGVHAHACFELAFREHGLPIAVRTDNGVPFATRGLAGLSRLSVWLLKLGIRPERIEPGHPEQNGRHERMHLTLKCETTRPAAHSELQQQERFDRFVEEYNERRPHEALGQRYPRELYETSPRALPATVPAPDYPLHDVVRTVSRCGHVYLFARSSSFYLSTALSGEIVGLREVDDGCWLVSFGPIDLGHFHERSRIFKPLNQPTPQQPLGSPPS